MAVTLESWFPSETPTKTTLKSIAATHAPGLESTLKSVMAKASTVTSADRLYLLSEQARGAQASLTIIEAQNVLATATDDSIKARATQAIFAATLNLKDLAQEENLYGIYLSRPGNIIYLAVFTIQFVFFLAMVYKSRFHWFNITFVCGYGLEFAGFVGRVLSFSDNTFESYYLLQFITLTIAPAFIMAGIYFLFAQCVVILGRKFSFLKPMWYSYFFIGADVFSLVVQSIGGAMASTASSNNRDPTTGKDIMIAGIVFQVFAMSCFLASWLWFLKRCYFQKVACHQLPPDHATHPMAKFTPLNYFRMMFLSPKARQYFAQYREPLYNPMYAPVRQRPTFKYLPLGITAAVIVVYVRCVYRVVELIQGFSGYLITHEVYLMVLDALMIALCGFVFFPLHPVISIGSDNVITRRNISKRMDEEFDEEKEKASESSL